MFTHAPLHHAQDSRGGDVENPPSDHLSSSEILTNRPDRVVLKVDQETFSNGKNLLCIARGWPTKSALWLASTRSTFSRRSRQAGFSPANKRLFSSMIPGRSASIQFSEAGNGIR
jgi:hypothetical protein